MSKNGITPIGECRYAKLFKPDTKYNAQGIYSVDLVFNKEDVADLINNLNEELTNFIEEKKKQFLASNKGHLVPALEGARREVFKPEYDSQGQPTGRVTLSFKQNAKRVMPDNSIRDNIVSVYDASNQLITNTDMIISNGSQLRISYWYFPYYVSATGAGIKLGINAVQVVKLAETTYSGRTAESFGFEPVQGGFSTPNNASPNPFTSQGQGIKQFDF